MPGEKKSATPAEGLILNVTNAVLIPGKKSKGGGEGGSSVPYVVHARTTDGYGAPIDFPICILREKLTENATLGSTFPSDAPLEFELHKEESINSNSAIHLSGYLQMDPSFGESDEDEEDDDYMPFEELEGGEDEDEDESGGDKEDDSQSDELEGEEMNSEDNEKDVTQSKGGKKHLFAGNAMEDDEDSKESDDVENDYASEEEEDDEIKPSKGVSKKVTELVDSEADESDMSEDDEEEPLSSKPQQHAKGKGERGGGGGGGGSFVGRKEMPAGAKRKLSNLASAAANANPEVKRHQTPKKHQQHQTPTSKGVVATPQTTGSGKKRNRNRGKKNKSK